MPMISDEITNSLVKNKKYTPLSIAMVLGKYEKLSLKSSWYSRLLAKLWLLS